MAPGSATVAAGAINDAQAPISDADGFKNPEKKGSLDGIIAQAQGSGEDYIADTFAQFGLNINNLLTGGANSTDDAANAGGANKDESKSMADATMSSLDRNKQSSKLTSILDAIPDFSFLTEPSVSMGQLFV